MQTARMGSLKVLIQFSNHFNCLVESNIFFIQFKTWFNGMSSNKGVLKDGAAI